MPPQLSGCGPQSDVLPGTHAVAAVSGVHPHCPATPPPPQVSYAPEQVQVSDPPQPSGTFPHSVPLHTPGVQQLPLLHSRPALQVQLTVPPQPSGRVPHWPASEPVHVAGVQQLPPLHLSLGLGQPHGMMFPQPSGRLPQLPGGSAPQAWGVQHGLVPRLHVCPLLQPHWMMPPHPSDCTPQVPAG